jgi:hypothetical protein
MKRSLICLICRQPFEAVRSDARYCSRRCSKAAQRSGIARSGSEPVFEKVAPSPVPRLTRKPTINQLASLVVTTRGIAEAFRVAARKADVPLRPVCSRIADAIDAALDAEAL